HLGCHPELAVVLDDIAGADGIDGHFHGLTAQNEWNSASPARGGTRPAAPSIKGRRRLQPRPREGVRVVIVSRLWRLTAALGGTAIGAIGAIGAVVMCGAL